MYFIFSFGNLISNVSLLRIFSKAHTYARSLERVNAPRDSRQSLKALLFNWCKDVTNVKYELASCVYIYIYTHVY